MRHHRLVAVAIVLLAIVQPRAHAEDCSGYGDTAILQRINQWDTPGDPWGVAVDPQGYVFVTDPINHRICRYSLNGESPYFFGTYGSGNGEFNEPRWLAFDPVRGRLYVGCQEGPARIQAFNRDGGFLFKIGEPPYDEQPGHFAGSIGGLALDSAGNVFVSDEQGDTGSYRSRIQVFNTSGNFVRIFRTVIAPPNNTPGEWQSLVDIEITSDDEVFVLDTGLPDYWQKRVHHLHIDGTPVDIWGVNGDGPGEFNYPSDLSSDDEFIWVACLGRLMKFRRNGEFIIEFNGQEPRQFQSIDHHPDAPTFLFAGSFVMGTAPERLEVFAPAIPAYNVLDSHWLDTNYEIVGDDPALFLDCDASNLPVDAVAADGVTPVLLRYEFTTPYSVTWSITDLNPGSVPGGFGELASIDGSQNGGSVTVTTEDVGGRHFAFVLYTAPIDFDRAGCPEDLPLETRGVRIYMEFEPVGGGVPGTYFRDLDIVRPPVVFVHGIWGRPSQWNQFRTVLNDPRWSSTKVDYFPSHGQPFSANAPLVLGDVRAFRESFLRGSRTAVAQVDLIAHSMGGCLARKIADGANYRGPSNLGQGDFHKLLTLNTPHFGSPLATAVVSLRSQLPSSRTAIAVIKLLGRAFSTEASQIIGGAIDDLSPGSGELSAFQSLDVPTHAHVGVGGSELLGILSIVAKVDASAAVYMALAYLTDEPALEEFENNAHDLVVLSESQTGGLAPNYYQPVSHDADGLHLRALDANTTGALALQWVQTPTGNTDFFSTLPAPPLSTPRSEPEPRTLPDWGGGKIAIATSSYSGIPGQEISVTATALNGVALTEVIVGYPGGALLLEPPMFTGTFTIPTDRYGSIPLHALGTTEDGKIVESNEDWINVDQTGQPVSISAEPEELIFSGPGGIRVLTIRALFPDGISRDLTPVASSLYFSGYNAMVIREDEARSAVQALRSGSTTLTVEFAGLSVDVPVTVLDGDRINNPPHACAGAEYEFCGGAEFSLDASESFDDDDRWGDNLTYRWDLDGDGLFDDAFGVTPTIILDDGSREHIAVLEVSDTEGQKSIDVAILKPLLGFCQATVPLCEVGQDNPQYDDFPALRDIDIDASGGFHVLVGPWMHPAETRIVSFDSQCGFLSEFALDFGPSDLAVSPDGTIYVSDTFETTEIRRFRIGGQELTPIALPGLGDDKLYNGGNLEVDPDGNICIDVTETNVNGNLIDFEVHVVSNAGSLVRSVSAADDLGITVSNGNCPEAFEIGPDGAVYLLAGETLYRSTNDGQYALDLTINLETNQQGGSDIAVGDDGSMYVVNCYGVHRFLIDGTYESSRTKAGPLTFYNLQGIAVDCANRVFLAERTNNAWVIQFDGDVGSIATPTIDESSVSLTRTFDLENQTETWTFVWDTDVESELALDRVRFGSVTGACADLVAQLTPAAVDSSSIVQVGDKFRHTLIWSGIPCTPSCIIPYCVESGVACYIDQSGWRNVKIVYCPKRL